jgi:hypothetical protein
MCGICLLAPHLQAREVQLSWEPMEAATEYEIWLAPSIKYEESSTIKKTLAEPTLSIELEVGNYFYKVRALDSKKIHGLWSESQKFSVLPYPPETQAPLNDSEYSYFEILPTINFEWNEVDGKPEYEVFIAKSTGQKVIELRTNDTKISTEKLTEADYLWKVRTIYKKIYISEYSDEKKFRIIRKNIEPPVLISPSDKKLMPAYREVNFEWKKDSATKFTDLKIESLDKSLALKNSTRSSKQDTLSQYNLSDSKASIEYFEPGDYGWRVTTKEAKTTKGVSSEKSQFSVRNDLLSDDNFSGQYEMGLTLVDNSFQTTRGGSNVGSNTTQAWVNRATLSKFFNLGFGANLEVQSGTGALKNNTIKLDRFTGSLRLRFGSPGFNQQFILGVRQSTNYEVTDSKFNYFTNLGPLIGTEVVATVADNFRLQLGANYFASSIYSEDKGTLEGDTYDAKIGLSWNAFYKYWITYNLRYQKSVHSYKEAGNENFVTNWNQFELSPIWLGLAFEH